MPFHVLLTELTVNEPSCIPQGVIEVCVFDFQVGIFTLFSIGFTFDSNVAFVRTTTKESGAFAGHSVFELVKLGVNYVCALGDTSLALCADDAPEPLQSRFV